MKRATLMTVVGAGLAGSLLAGCAEASTSPIDEPPVGTIAAVRAGSEIRLPLDQYLLSDRQIQVIARAQNILVRRCMKSFGLDWPAALPPRKAAPAEIDNSRRYYVVDEEVARVNGYHAPAGYERQTTALAHERPPPAEVLGVWTGQGPGNFRGRPVPRQGCAGQASRVLGEGTAGDPVDVQQLQLDTLARSRKDSRVVRVNVEWRKCMAEAGYSFSDPRAANNDGRWQRAGLPSATEVATAVDDVKCKKKHNMPGVMMAVESAYQQVVIARRSDDLAELKRRTTAVVAVASQVDGDSR